MKFSPDLPISYPSRHMVYCDWGRPLKGLSREKTPLPQEKSYFFSLTLQLLSSRSLSVVYFVSRPLFPFMVRVVFDPHQSLSEA